MFLLNACFADIVLYIRVTGAYFETFMNINNPQVFENYEVIIFLFGNNQELLAKKRLKPTTKCWCHQFISNQVDSYLLIYCN